MIITIDGPAGTGKSTIAKTLAQKWQISYVDTGAMYRIVTLTCLREGIKNESEQLENILKHLHFRTENQRFFLDKEDVTEIIRDPQINAQVSYFSTFPMVRKKLLELQRQEAKKGNAIFEGRDMGTTVFPEAELKIFLTASIEERAKRRFKELQEKKLQTSYEEVLASVAKRDEIDTTRELSPLIQANDAHVLDTTNLSIEQVIDQINIWYLEVKK